MRDRLVHAATTPGCSCGRTRDPRFEVAVAAQVSPAGPAGRRPLRLRRCCRSAPPAHGGFDVLGSHWDVMEERSAEFGTTVDRRGWRLVGPMHIAETKEQAYAGRRSSASPSGSTTSSGSPRSRSRPDTDDADELADAMNASGFAVIGTPDDAIAQIQRLVDQSGGFGTFLLMAPRLGRPRGHPAQSYELLARYVFPQLPGLGRSTTDGRATGRPRTGPTFIGAAGAAVMTAIAEAPRGEGEPRPRPSRRAGRRRLTAADWHCVDRYVEPIARW